MDEKSTWIFIWQAMLVESLVRPLDESPRPLVVTWVVCEVALNNPIATGHNKFLESMLILIMRINVGVH